MEVNTTDHVRTTTPMPKSGTTPLPLLGWPGRDFYSLHLTALVSLTISVLASSAVMVILRPTCPAFWKRTIGERLVVYLAACDLLFSLSHILDHAYMLHARDHPPDDVCTGFAFFVATFLMTQAFVVSFTAVNAFVLVVKERRVDLGRYDWRLLVTTVVVPLTIMVPAAFLGWLGPSGGWCITDMRRTGGKVLTNIMSLDILLTIAACCLSYLFVWVKIRRVTTTTARLGLYTALSLHHRTARIMMVFVVVYVLQWWTYVVYSVYSLVTPAPAVLVNVAVFTCNMGGVFNLVAYTVLRRRFGSMGREAGAGKAGEKGRTLSSSSSTHNTPVPASCAAHVASVSTTSPPTTAKSATTTGDPTVI